MHLKKWLAFLEKKIIYIYCLFNAKCYMQNIPGHARQPLFADRLFAPGVLGTVEASCGQITGLWQHPHSQGQRPSYQLLEALNKDMHLP